RHGLDGFGGVWAARLRPQVVKLLQCRNIKVPGWATAAPNWGIISTRKAHVAQKHGKACIGLG
ncbi:hypothetical protein LWS69_33815, partial [Bordetella hinzii]|nr:hypothetical protein [Bordetella hinzii]